MVWIAANWFWMLILVAFVAMHLFGHRGHAGHGGGSHQQRVNENDHPHTTVANTTAGGHQS